MPPKTRSRKRTDSNVGEGVITKKARKGKQVASRDDSDSVKGDDGKGREGKGGRGKARGGKAKGGKAIVKAGGKGGRYVLSCESIISK